MPRRANDVQCILQRRAHQIHPLPSARPKSTQPLLEEEWFHAWYPKAWVVAHRSLHHSLKCHVPVIEAPSILLVSAGVRQEMNQTCFRADSDFPCWNHTLKAWNRTHLRQRPSQGWIKNNSKWISTLLERVSSVFFSRLSSRNRFRFACLHKKSLEWHWCDQMSFIAVLLHLWSVTVFQEFDSSLVWILILKWSWLWDVFSAGKVHRKQMKQIISLESW